MVPMLSRFNNITVMTNSLHIVNALSELDNEQTIPMPGGTFRKNRPLFTAQLAENAFEQFSFDRLFMGTDGIDLIAGVTTFNEVYTVSKAMCNAAREVILMADSSKFGRKVPISSAASRAWTNRLPMPISARNLSGRWKTKASKSLLLENIMSNFLLEAGRQTLMLELQEASRLPERLGDDFIRAAETIIHCEGTNWWSPVSANRAISVKSWPPPSPAPAAPAFFVHRRKRCTAISECSTAAT